MRQLFLPLALLTLPVSAQNWSQWGATAQHHSSTPVVARNIDRIEAEIVLDPHADAMEAITGYLPAHYPVPLIDGDDVIVLIKTGSFTTLVNRETQVWNVVNLHRAANGQYLRRWTYVSDWKPVPYGSASWEPVYHPAVSSAGVWAPGAGGTIDLVGRDTGNLIQRFNPFGTTVDPTIFVAGPPVIDASGNVFYNAIQLNLASPWGSDPPNSWLVRIGADKQVSKATFASLTPSAPGANAVCTATFPNTAALPWPPAVDATAPAIRCGPQRPGINVSPAIAADGTIYTVSRAHFNARWGYLVAVNPNLTPKWISTMRNRFNDGCDVDLPPNGSPGGCRNGAERGVDPADNQPGSGQVSDVSTSSPVVAPDGRILYGSLTRYNYSQGHLMMFGPDGSYIAAYGWGWDLSPAIYRHDGTYSIILKENHYAAGSYCNDPGYCPFRDNDPGNPEVYYITQLNAAMQPEWKFRNTVTQSCERLPDGSLSCVNDHPNGFEWCVNAIAVDARGVVYANSEDGHLYAIRQGGTMQQRIFLRVALGAAYTATAIGPDGRVYTQNDGNLFIIDQHPKSRVVRRR